MLSVGEMKKKKICNVFMSQKCNTELIQDDTRLIDMVKELIVSPATTAVGYNFEEVKSYKKTPELFLGQFLDIMNVTDLFKVCFQETYQM